MTFPRAITDPPISEAGYQDTVAELLQLHKFLVFHARPAMTKKGYRTPVSYDGAGFPDLVAIGNGHVMFIEVKRNSMGLSPNQERWADVASEVSCLTDRVSYWTLRPKDWERFVGYVKGIRRRNG